MASSKCPACRGLIDSRARRCQHCRHDLTPAEQHQAETAGAVSSAMRIGVVIVAASVLAWCTSTIGGKQPGPVAGEHTASEREQCRAFVAQAGKAGLVIRRPTDKRVDVNELQWRAADANVKRVLVQAIACDLWGKDTPPEAEYVVVYGARSGRRMAILTEAGLAFD